MDRRSLLAEDSAYGQVAAAAIAASSRAAEAELISAKLRAEAASKNWLPTLGPSVSLTELGDLVAGLLIEQVLFDNGRRKAERAFAAADVEVAAVNLSEDMLHTDSSKLAELVSHFTIDAQQAPRPDHQVIPKPSAHGTEAPDDFWKDEPGLPADGAAARPAATGTGGASKWEDF